MDQKMHYVCTGGCQGVTDREGAMCEAKDCSKHDQPLTPCSCTDGQHREAFEKEGVSQPITTNN